MENPMSLPIRWEGVVLVGVCAASTVIMAVTITVIIRILTG
jgi:hypothetical protein